MFYFFKQSRKRFFFKYQEPPSESVICGSEGDLFISDKPAIYEAREMRNLPLHSPSNRGRVRRNK